MWPYLMFGGWKGLKCDELDTQKKLQESHNACS